MKFLIIILLALISHCISGQHMADTTAEKLLLFEIDFWKANSDSAKLNALLSKAEINKSSGLYEQAISELYRADKHYKDTAMASYINYEKMLNYFLSGQYSYSGNIVISPAEVERLHKKKEYTMIKLMSLNESEKWEKCKQELLSIASYNDSTTIVSIEALPIMYDYISPEYCSRLSSFVPGLGEMKAGYPVKGITTFLINSGLLFFTGYNFYYGFYLTGTISGGLSFLKFYNGSKRLSEKLAEKHNEKEKKDLKKQYVKMIEKVHPY